MCSAPRCWRACRLFSVEDGRLLSITDGHELTLIRTAAASALATDLLANPSPPNGATLAMLGTGDQVLVHLQAIRGVRKVGRVMIWGRSVEHARERAAEIAADASNPPVEVCDTAQQAVRCPSDPPELAAAIPLPSAAIQSYAGQLCRSSTLLCGINS